MRPDAQLEERVRDLQHEDMWMSVIMHDEDTLDRSSHPKVFIVVLQALKSRCDGGVFLGLCLLRAGTETPRVNILEPRFHGFMYPLRTHLNVKFDNGYLLIFQNQKQWTLRA